MPELTTLNSISIKFGDVDLKGSELIQLAQNIKTFTESRNDTMEFSAMQNDLNNCETLVFLGFGFHEINLKLLKFNERSKIRRIFGTTRGLSQDNKLYLEKYFRGIFNNQFGNDMMKLDKIDCWELFDNYSFSLGK